MSRRSGGAAEGLMWLIGFIIFAPLIASFDPNDVITRFLENMFRYREATFQPSRLRHPAA